MENKRNVMVVVDGKQKECDGGGGEWKTKEM